MNEVSEQYHKMLIFNFLKKKHPLLFSKKIKVNVISWLLNGEPEELKINAFLNEFRKKLTLRHRVIPTFAGSHFDDFPVT